MSERAFWVEIRRGLIGSIVAIEKDDRENLRRNLKRLVAAIEKRWEIDRRFDPPDELDIESEPV